MITEKYYYICLTCQTTEENNNTGMCINGHDNWFGSDELESVIRFKEACEKAGLTIEEMIEKFKIDES